MLVNRFFKLMPRTVYLTLIAVLSLSAGFGVLASSTHALTLPTSCNDASNEVIWCGAANRQAVANAYDSGDGHNSAVSIQNIYGYFGMTSGEINSMSVTAVAGTVTKSGEVFVNNTEVADNAMTAGRQYIPGSTKVTYKGTTFYVRPPSVSFLQASLDAFVVMSGNHFEFAILSSCGNPIVATALAPPPSSPTPTPTSTPTPTPSPTPTPNYTIQKLVAPDGSNNFVSEIEVNPNTKVDYKITVNSTGNTAVENPVIKDTLPSDDVYQTNTLTLNGTQLSSNQVGNFFGGGLQLSNIQAGQSDVFTFVALVGANQNNANCTNETLPNVATINATSLPTENATATVSVQCLAPTPTPPTPPKQLINTGPGSMVGIFAGVSLVSGIGYSFYKRRSLQ